MRTKLAIRGYPAIYLGHAKNHGYDTAKVLRISTRAVNLSRDLQWMNIFYCAWKGLQRSYVDMNGDQYDVDPPAQFPHEFPAPVDDAPLVITIDDAAPLYLTQADEADEDIEAIGAPDAAGADLDIMDEDINVDDIDVDDPPMTTRLERELFRIGAHNNEPDLPPLDIPHTYGGIQTRSATQASQAATTTDAFPNDLMMFNTNVGFAAEGDTPPIPTADDIIDDMIRNRDTWEEVARIMHDLDVNEPEIVAGDPEELGATPTEFLEWEENVLFRNDKSWYKDNIELPKNFTEAWNHPVRWIRDFWREAIRKEHKKMEIHKVWKLVNRSTIPQGRRCIKFRWIFEIKRNGVFRARLVACGYSQIAGIDFTDVYSPVVNDIAWRIILVLQILTKYSARVMDIETAFLHGDLEEEIYMEVPDGIKSKGDQVVLLEKSLYGLVQSARQFYKKLVDTLKSIGFEQSKAEPCLLFRKGAKGSVYMVVHVDDCYAIGDDEALDEVVVLIEKKGLKIKVETDTQDYLSCEVQFNSEKTGAWMGQPHLMKKLERTYSDLVYTSNLKYKTPGTPGVGLIRSKDEKDQLPDEEQQVYRSAVGTLIQFIKYSRPDIANPVRELSKCAGVANAIAFKEMKRVIKFLLDTKEMGLKVFPLPLKENKYQLKVFSDSDWAGDRETRHSVTGFVIYIQNVPIMWKSRSQKSVSLSSSEAEFYAISEAVKELRFVYQILISLNMEVELPINVYVDNVGAIFMSENVSATSRTKHVDIRYHYVREFIEDKFIKLIFVRSEDNKSDSFTKNVSGEIYDSHISDFIIEKNKLLH